MERNDASVACMWCKKPVPVRPDQVGFVVAICGPCRFKANETAKELWPGNFSVTHSEPNEVRRK